MGENKTILLSTHILQEVEAIASRVLFINEGRLVYDGPVSGLTTGGQSLDERFHELTAHGSRKRRYVASDHFARHPTRIVDRTIGQNTGTRQSDLKP